MSLSLQIFVILFSDIYEIKKQKKGAHDDQRDLLKENNYIYVSLGSGYKVKIECSHLKQLIHYI